MKKNHQKKGLHVHQDFRIDTSVSKEDTVSGDLNDLAPAIKASLDNYLALVDIGEWFKKIQVAATTNVNWSEKLPDGTDLRDPIKAVQIEVAYPDYSSAAMNELQLKSQASGFHYTPGHKDPSQGGQLARWTADNPNDIINVSFLRLEKSLPKWDSNQVKVTKIISYDPSDPRVEISGDKTTIKKDVILQGGAVVVDPDEVGLIHVRFALAAGPLPDYVTATLSCKVGTRTDTFTITNQNQKNVIWEIFSDKYFNTTSFQYTLQVTVNGPTFLDAPIQFETPQPITVPLPTGRLKYLGTKVLPFRRRALNKPPLWRTISNALAKARLRQVRHETWSSGGDGSAEGSERVSLNAMARVMLPAQKATTRDPSLPIFAENTGNLYSDRDNPSLRWYMPAYEVDDPNPSFGFVASQAGSDSLGNPANKVRITMSLKKLMPPDVVQFNHANPNVQLRELPLRISSISLVATFKDSSSGETRHSSYSAVVTPGSNGALNLTFDNILGASVVVLYENLVMDGTAQLSFAASADMLVSPPRALQSPASLGGRPIPTPSHPVSFSPVLMVRRQPVQPGRRQVQVVRRSGAAKGKVQVVRRGPIQNLPHRPPPPLPPSPQFVKTTLSKATAIAIGTRFAANEYQLKFSVTSPAGTRTILGVQDLKTFEVQQTEFTELKALGDISLRYPSLSRLYLGVLSKTIVVVPRRYAIVRDSGGCMAACHALLDSASSAVSRCKFELTFVLAPEISPVDFLKLSQEVRERADFKGYTLTLPGHLSDKPAASISTSFQSSFQYSAGLQPHSFTLAVSIRDKDLDSPAVANANLFLAMLAALKPPYLGGALSLKLDDGYAHPVQADVVLNFVETSGTDELTFEVDSSAGAIRLTNHSPLDLAISRCALVVGRTISEVPLKETVPGGGTTTIPLPEKHPGVAIVADSQLALPARLNKHDLTKYLAFQVQDVQNTQFVVSVNASGVNFKGRGIDKIDLRVTFPSLPAITPAPLSLNELHTADGTQILIPIQNAITELVGTVSFRVQFLDPQKPSAQFTMQNDFCSEAVVVVNDADLPPS